MPSREVPTYAGALEICRRYPDYSEIIPESDLMVIAQLLEKITFYASMYHVYLNNNVIHQSCGYWRRGRGATLKSAF